MSSEIKKTSRRKFFQTTALAAVGFTFLTSLPGRVIHKFSGNPKHKVKIHPSAVRRNR